jgi:hypothetical protein
MNQKSKIEKLKLIKGTFNPVDAKEILMNIFSTKIQFHQLKNFSSQIRFGKEDEIAVQRINELKNEIEKFQKLFAELPNINQKILLNSEIKIRISQAK